MKSLILVIEDEEAIRELIALNLKAAGFDVALAAEGQQALEQIDKIDPDLVLLDWMLPGMPGLEVLRKLRSDPKWATLPIMMLTAKSEESDIVMGLELGASDYLTKPFSNKVLIARIRVLLRRPSEPVREKQLRYLGLKLWPETHRATLDGEEVNLTTGEFELLELLCERPGHIFSRAQIISQTKGEGYPVTDRAVDVQILSLRRKLGLFGERIETVRGSGYRMRT